MKTMLIALLGLVAVVAAYLVSWPTPIDPVAYEPPRGPALEGVLAPNTALRAADHVGTGHLNGPEDLALDAEGRIYVGSHTGLIQRLHADGSVEVFADTGGRPLGMSFDADGNLIVADAWRGLLSIDPSGAISVLATGADGVPFAFTNDLDIASDGTIYFSDASSRFNQPDYLYDLLEARPHGRLLRYDPATGETTTLLGGLYFANGVALSQHEDFVLVNETSRYRITRYWLSGERAGQSDIFIDNLPGFPDNLSATRDGRFWLALFTVRNPQMDGMHARPHVKKVVSRLPRAMWPQPAPHGFVAELNEYGAVIRTLQDPGGVHLRAVTSAKEIGGTLYLGSLYNDRIGVLPLDRAAQ
jgi:sugar lactone lactonase YvrE